MSYTKGFKAFDKVPGQKAGKCRDMYYKEGKTYTVEGELVLCSNGLHFCKDLVLTFQYYGHNTEKYAYAEVEALGDVVYEEPTKHKAATNKLKVVRFLADEEVENLIDLKRNSGDWNSGNGNSGNWNSGDWNSGERNSGNDNSGNRNSGDWNSGNRNSGHGNSGNRNSGHGNSGDWNSGNGNSGNWNSGDWNSGDWNSCNQETGYFNSKQAETIRAFNKECSRSEWHGAVKPSFLYFTIEKDKTYKQCFQEAYQRAKPEEVALLKALPNFDPEVFYEISGIKIDEN